jgi:protein O-mannosyl-transferase
MSKRNKPQEIKKKPIDPLVKSNFTKNLRTYLGIIIALFAFVLYIQSVTFSYTLDDSAVIKDNKVTTKGIQGISTILTKDYWYGFSDMMRVPEYRPASLIMFALEWQFFPENPHVSHLINVLLYSLTCWLLYLVLCKLFEKYNLLVPFICSLLFVAHPIHTEIVDSIKSRDEILCFLFSILSVFFVLKYFEKQTIFKLILAGIFFFISLLSKETSIVFIILIPLILYVFKDIPTKKIVSITLIFIGVTGVFLFIRAQVLSTFSAMNFDSPINNSLFAAPDFVSQKATEFYILLKYIYLLIIPYQLSYDYSYAQIPTHQLSDLGAIAGIVIYAAMFIYAALNIKKKNVFAFAILFYLLTLAPVSNIFLLIGSPMAERFMYMPSVGFTIVLALLALKLTKTEQFKSKVTSFKEFFSFNSKLFIIIFVLTGIYSFRTIERSQDWKNNLNLFGHDVKIAENSARVHTSWGAALLYDLYPAEKDKKKKDSLLDLTIIELKKAIEIFDKASEYNYVLATAYMDKNDYKNAIENFEIYKNRYSKPKPDVYKHLGTMYLKTKQFDKEIVAMDSLIKYEPDLSEAYNNKACALFEKKEYSLAEVEFQKAIKLDPKNANAYKNAGVNYLNLNEKNNALDYLMKSVDLDSSDLQTINYLGQIYKSMGDSLNSKKYFAKAKRLNSAQKK